MTACEPIIAVADVEASSRWYCDLLNLRSNHGGRYFDQLVSGDQTVLLLHHWGAEEHPSMRSPDNGNVGNGLVLYFRVADVQAVFDRAKELSVRTLGEPALNELSHQTEFSLYDPDGYYLTIST